MSLQKRIRYRILRSKSCLKISKAVRFCSIQMPGSNRVGAKLSQSPLLSSVIHWRHLVVHLIYHSISLLPCLLLLRQRLRSAFFPVSTCKVCWVFDIVLLELYQHFFVAMAVANRFANLGANLGLRCGPLERLCSLDTRDYKYPTPTAEQQQALMQQAALLAAPRKPSVSAAAAVTSGPVSTSLLPTSTYPYSIAGKNM